MEPTYLEIPMRGCLALAEENPVQMALGEGGEHAALGLPVVPMAGIVGKLGEASAAGCRVVLLSIDSIGGNAFAALGMWSALRAFSESGGAVVAYVSGWAASSAAIAVLGADFVVVHPKARIGIHGLVIAPGPELEAAGGFVEAFDGAFAAIVEAGSLVSGREVKAWLARRPTRSDPGGMLLDARKALELGVADFVGGQQRARELAERLARGEVVTSERRRALAQRPEGFGDSDALQDARQTGTAIMFQGALESAIASRMTALWIAIGAVSELLSGRGPEEGDEDEDDPENEGKKWANWALRKTLVAPLTTLPFLGQFVEAGLQGKRVSERGAPGMALLQSIWKAFEAAADEEPDLARAIEEAARASGITFGVPTARPLRAAQYVRRVLQDETEAPRGPGDVASGVIFTGGREGAPENIPSLVQDEVSGER